MKALTVRQPWAWAIVHGGKGVENRTRNIAGGYRGPLAIHAGLREDEAAYHDDLIKEALGQYDDSWLLQEQLVTGAFVGVVDLIGAHVAQPQRIEQTGPMSFFGSPPCCYSAWAEQSTGIVHLVLANRRPLERPISCAGKLGLWTPPAEVLDELREVAL